MFFYSGCGYPCERKKTKFKFIYTLHHIVVSQTKLLVEVHRYNPQYTSNTANITTNVLVTKLHIEPQYIAVHIMQVCALISYSIY